MEKAKAGDFEVNLYDDAGYSAMKRVLERGDDATSIKPLVTIVVNHPVSAGHIACLWSVLDLKSAITYWAVRNFNRLRAGSCTSELWINVNCRLKVNCKENLGWPANCWPNQPKFFLQLTFILQFTCTWSGPKF